MERQDEQGEFNQAIAYLYRLDDILKTLNYASMNKQYDTKFDCLFVFYKELYPMMNVKDRQRHNEMAWVVRSKYEEYKRALKLGKTRISTEAIDVMDMWDADLRDCMHAKGMLMPKKTDPRFALGSK